MEAIASTKLSANFQIPVRFARSTLRVFNVTKNCVIKDIQKSANGGRGQVAVGEQIVIICMLLLQVMMEKEIKLTKATHVLDAKAALTAVCMLCSMK